MNSRIFLLPAALAMAALAALPAFAEGTSPAAPVAQPPAAQVETGVKTPGTQASTDAKSDAHKDKVSKSKQHNEQVAGHPATATKGSTSTGTDTKSEPAKQ
jgi:hypothetical protein